MKQLFVLLFLILSINNIHSQCKVILESKKLLPSIEYYNGGTILVEEDSDFIPNYMDCEILVVQDSNLNQTIEATLKLANKYDYILIFPLIEFDTIVTTSNQIFPKKIFINDFILLFNIFTGERGAFFVPSFKGLGIVTDEKIIDIDDLEEIENYMWKIVSQCKFYIKPNPEVLCVPPKKSIGFRFDIWVTVYHMEQSKNKEE